MKNIKSIICAGAILMSGAFTSCTDGMDNWDVDPAFDRLFAPTSVKLTPGSTDVLVEYEGNNAAQQYQIQLSTDTLNNDVADDAEGLINVFGPQKSTTVTGLVGDTYYYIRLRAVSDNAKCSHWLYYRTSGGMGKFHTNAEQIFNEVQDADRTASSVRVTWTPGAEVTALQVVNLAAEEGTEPTVITLDDAAKAAGEYTITDLEGSTGYKISILNGDAVRGSLTITTPADAPKGDFTYYMTAADQVIDTQFLNGIATQAKEKAGSETNYSATIVLQKGSTVKLYGVGEDGSITNLKIPTGMSVTFFGEGSTPATIEMDNQINLAGSHGYVKFQNLNIVGKGGYFVNQSQASTVETVEVRDCNVSGFSTAFFRIQGLAGLLVNKLILANSTFDNMCTGYSFIHVDANMQGVVNDIDIDGCTFTNIAKTGKMFIYSKKTNMDGGISIKNSTFYNVIGSGNYFIDFGDKTYGPANGILIEKCLFGMGADQATNKNIRAVKKPDVVESYHTNDWFKVLGTEPLEGSSADYFENPAELNFKLIKETPNPCGDPRWY